MGDTSDTAQSLEGASAKQPKKRQTYLVKSPVNLIPLAKEWCAGAALLQNHFFTLFAAHNGRSCLFMCLLTCLGRQLSGFMA
jgi:hypothetical protein